MPAVASTAYRFSVFDMEQLVLLDGHLIYKEPAVGFCLWTYDYDVDSNTYMIDGYIELKFPMTVEEVLQLTFFAEHSCISLSHATTEDMDYYNAIHTSVRGGWNPDMGAIHTVTPVLETDEVLPPQAEWHEPDAEPDHLAPGGSLHRTDGCHLLEMEDDE